MSSYLYQRLTTDKPNKNTMDRRNSSLLLLVMQLLHMDCVPLGEFILKYTLEQDENECEGVDQVDLAKAACFIKTGQVRYFSFC